MRKQSRLWLASTRSFTTPEIAPAFAVVKRSFAGSRMSINGNGVIWRSAPIDGDDVSFADDKAGGFPELNKYHVNLQTIFSIARRRRYGMSYPG